MVYHNMVVLLAVLAVALEHILITLVAVPVEDIVAVALLIMEMAIVVAVEDHIMMVQTKPTLPVVIMVLV